MRAFFKVCRVHYCFSQELCEPRPKKCKCRKLITREQAQYLVDIGAADWILEHNRTGTTSTWHIVLRGKAAKTPRAHTLESPNPVRAPRAYGHIERGIDSSRFLESDNGTLAEKIELLEEASLFDIYHELALEERYRLFACSEKLQELKKASDALKTISGETAKKVDRLITFLADSAKFSVFRKDGREGLPILPLIGRE